MWKLSIGGEYINNKNWHLLKASSHPRQDLRILRHSTYRWKQKQHQNYNYR